jgi:hypothetical protein
MAGSASEEEAAAIAAAIARFESETAAAPVEEAAKVGPWQRAALLEGVSAKGAAEDTEGGSRWLS